MVILLSEPDRREIGCWGTIMADSSVGKRDPSGVQKARLEIGLAPKNRAAARRMVLLSRLSEPDGGKSVAGAPSSVGIVIRQVSKKRGWKSVWRPRTGPKKGSRPTRGEAGFRRGKLVLRPRTGSRLARGEAGNRSGLWRPRTGENR